MVIKLKKGRSTKKRQNPNQTKKQKQQQQNPHLHCLGDKWFWTLALFVPSAFQISITNVECEQSVFLTVGRSYLFLKNFLYN